jgi:nucleoside-diphosphate-sugar epimerase
MKVFVTGATGLIGAHTSLELLRAGHEVRLLVRNQQAAYNYFLNHGFKLNDFVVTDMLDKAAVKKSMAGCDAVAHIAAIVDLNAQNANTTQTTNLKSIESVIGSACELGIEKILYVSSMSVFYNFDLPTLTEETPLANVKDAYSLSKKLCEVRVRELQSQGKPIVSTYPVAVFGPDDPKMAESNGAIIRFVQSMMPLTSSGMQFVDARDVGKANRLLLEKELADDKTQERYIIGGYYPSWPELADMIELALGQKLRRIIIPGPIFRFLGAAFDALRHIIPIEYPISKEGMTIVTRLPPAQSSKLLKTTGMTFIDPKVTIQDTVNWMRSSHKL